MTQRDWRPRYLQLAEELRGKILSGELSAGAPLPSEPDLAASTGISRTSVRNAIRQLRDWGLIRAEQGRGTFVRAPRQRVRRHPTERYQWEKDRARGTEAERRKTGATEHDTGLAVDDLEFRSSYETVGASDYLAERLGVRPGTRLLLRTYQTSSRSEKAPLSIARSYLVYDVVAANPDLLDESKEPWPGGTQNQLHTIGVELDRIIDEIRARPPMPEEADTLAIEPGVSVFVLTKVSVDTGGRVVELSEIIMPADRTDLLYTIRLKRWRR